MSKGLAEKTGSESQRRCVWHQLDRRTALWEVRGLARRELEGLALPRRGLTPAFAPERLDRRLLPSGARAAVRARQKTECEAASS